MMSDDQNHDPKTEKEATPQPRKDSFGVPVEKSPWLMYALIQIPLVLIMVVIVYVMYQQSQN
jgi:hypothetical protein